MTLELDKVLKETKELKELFDTLKKMISYMEDHQSKEEKPILTLEVGKIYENSDGLDVLIVYKDKNDVFAGIQYPKFQDGVILDVFNSKGVTSLYSKELIKELPHKNWSNIGKYE